MTNTTDQFNDDDILVASAMRASDQPLDQQASDHLDQALLQDRSLVEALLHAAEEHAIAVAKQAKAAAIAVRNALFTAVGMTTLTVAGTAGAVVATTIDFDPRTANPSTILVDQPKTNSILPAKILNR